MKKVFEAGVDGTEQLSVWWLLDIHHAHLHNEPRHDKANKIRCAPSEDSDQPGHPTSLIRVFALRLMGS